MQIMLILEIALEKYGFVHNDLTPWNIIICKSDGAEVYNVPYKGKYRIKSSYYPVMIDYEKSHVIYNGLHFGKVNMFNLSTIQDTLTILSTSVYNICNKSFNNETVCNIISLSNFITGTGYRRERFRVSGRDGLGDVRHFFSKAKKFGEIINSNKHELEKLKPFDLFLYMKNTFKVGIEEEKFSINPVVLGYKHLIGYEEEIGKKIEKIRDSSLFLEREIKAVFDDIGYMIPYNGKKNGDNILIKPLDVVEIKFDDTSFLDQENIKRLLEKVENVDCVDLTEYKDDLYMEGV